MNFNKFVVFDLETGSASPQKAEIIEVAAAALDRKTLKVIDTIELKMRPEDMEAVEDGALQVTGFIRSEVEKYPATSVVWPTFVNWINKHNTSKGNPSPYNAPIACGYNIIGYDIPIIRRYCKKYKTAWDDKREDQKLFNQIYMFDVLHHLHFWFENLPIENLKLTTIRQYMGFSEESIGSAHRALPDVLDTAKIVTKLIGLQRWMTAEVDELDLTGNKTGKRKRRMEMKDCMKNV